jgi:hypothetical protein
MAYMVSVIFNCKSNQRFYKNEWALLYLRTKQQAKYGLKIIVGQSNYF